MSFTKNQRVAYDGGQIGEIERIGKSGKLYIRTQNGEVIKRVQSRVFPVDSDMKIVMPDSDEYQEMLEQNKPKQWETNKKFEFMENLVDMVLDNVAVSLIITGDPGLGKTYTVTQQIEAKGLVNGEDYLVIKGFSSARGLFRVLYENQYGLLVFDDCDEVLKNDVARNILKSALDSYDKRIVSWVVKTEDESLPSSFEFFGRIIFISNMSVEKVDQAIISRSLSIDLTMNPEDKLQRMQDIIPKMMTGLGVEMKMECLELIRGNKHKCRDLNIRTLIKVIKIRQAHPNNWQELAEYMILN